MDTQMIVELVGYFASLLVLVSFLMTSVIKLRIVDSIGALIFAVYAVIIRSYPTALMNLALVGINMYYLYKIIKSPRRYAVITEEPGSASLAYFLKYYGEDIQKCFPGLAFEKSGMNAAYMVVHDTVPAGILLGRDHQDGNFEIFLDYATPQYRDCSVGEYLYAELGGRGIERISFPDVPEEHEEYLKKTGFVKEDGVYGKRLK